MTPTSRACKTTPRVAAGGCVLAHEARQERHGPPAPGRVRKPAPGPRAHAGALARHDLTERGQVPLERIRVLVVDRVDILLAEIARAIDGLLLDHGHNRGSRAPPFAKGGVGDGLVEFRMECLRL